MPYQTIEVRKLTPHIGAEIGGVDLSCPLGNQQFQEVHDALMENLVVFFRGQTLTHDQHKAFGRLFGELAIHPASPHAPEGHPEILTIHADENSKHVAGEEWHSDVSCDAEPPLGSILYLTEVPPEGGDTRATLCWRCCTGIARRRNSNAASAGSPARWRSGTIAARSTTQCGTTSRNAATATGSRSRATGRSKRPLPHRGGSQEELPKALTQPDHQIRLIMAAS